MIHAPSHIALLQKLHDQVLLPFYMQTSHAVGLAHGVSAVVKCTCLTGPRNGDTGKLAISTQVLSLCPCMCACQTPYQAELRGIRLADGSDILVAAMTMIDIDIDTLHAVP